jgi:hypothetical protein
MYYFLLAAFWHIANPLLFWILTWVFARAQLVDFRGRIPITSVLVLAVQVAVLQATQGQVGYLRIEAISVAIGAIVGALLLVAWCKVDRMASVQIVSVYIPTCIALSYLLLAVLMGLGNSH